MRSRLLVLGLLLSCARTVQVAEPPKPLAEPQMSVVPMQKIKPTETLSCEEPPVLEVAKTLMATTMVILIAGPPNWREQLQVLGSLGHPALICAVRFAIRAIFTMAQDNPKPEFHEAIARAMQFLAEEQGAGTIPFLHSTRPRAI